MSLREDIKRDQPELWAKVKAQADELRAKALPTSAIDYDLKDPCGDCPFTKAAPFHEGVAGSLPLYLVSIEEQTFAHTCHKTDTREGVDGPMNWDGRPKHCRGLLIMLAKTGGDAWLQSGLMAGIRDGRLSLKELVAAAKADTRCYTLGEFRNFYLREIKKRAGIRLRRKRGRK